MNRTRVMIICLIAGVVSGCGSHEHEYHSVLERIAHEGRDSVSSAIDNRNLVEEEYVKAEVVDYSDVAFYVESRTKKIVHFECSECHSKPLTSLRSEAPVSGKKAHWDIALNHAHSSIMKCNTCHNMDEAPDRLLSLQSDTLLYAHSYKLCGQCHSTQYKDWQGGAHGKKLGGWSQPRIIKTCTGCHNPHRPAFDMRWPARLNTDQVLREQELEHE